MGKPIIDDLFRDDNISQRILFHLSDRDLSNCALVNRVWRYAVHISKPKRTLRVTAELIHSLKRKKITLENHIKDNFKLPTEIDIIGWSRKFCLPSDIYDKLLTRSDLPARALTLRGRGQWDTCYCPNEKFNKGELTGTNINKDEKTNFQYIHIGCTFVISACAFLDLIARSPKLKTLRFNGTIINRDHAENFQSKLFCSDIETIYWPLPSRKHWGILKILVKRNENVTGFYSNGQTTCELLSCDTLPNLKYLSLFLNENWCCEPNHTKKAYKYVEAIQYYATAKKLEGLEIRTLEPKFKEEPEDQENGDLQAIRDTNTKAENYYEQFKTAFWSSLGQLKNLKYLAIYGSWELDEVCREMSRNLLTIEYLKISLMPSAVRDQVEDITYAMGDGFKYLRNLVNLRSVQYDCYEKLIDIDSKAILQWKEIYDKIWLLDIKVAFTQNVEDFLLGLNRRGNQLGKSYCVLVNVSTKTDINCRFVFEKNIKSLGPNIKERLHEIADKESVKRYKEKCDNIYLWGIKQIGNTRDTVTFNRLKKDWTFYEDKFDQSVKLI